MNKNQWKAVSDKLKRIIGEPPPDKKIPTLNKPPQKETDTNKEALTKEKMPENTVEWHDYEKHDRDFIDRKFIDIFHRITYRHSDWEVWNDFVTLSACALSNPVDKSHFDVRENLYLKTIQKYEKSEQKLFPELLSLTVMSLDNNPEQDFLGRLYMRLNLNSSTKGQFFTPYNVCELMGEMIIGDGVVDEVKKQGYISIHDPCCGAGATLIAAVHATRKKLEKENLNYQNHVLVVAQDIDPTVAMMCYIQISLLGVAGYVKVGDSITDPIAENDSTENYWFTPMYFSNVWSTRRMIFGIDKILKKENLDGGN